MGRAVLDITAHHLGDLLERHARWWERKGALIAYVPSAPLGDLWLPLSDGTVAVEDVQLSPGMVDVEAVVGPPKEPGALECVGDRIRTVSPYGRIPWVEAIFGCPIWATIQGGSMRTLSFVRDWDDWRSRPSHWDEDWYALLMEITSLLASRCGGRYTVAHTLMRGPSDLAEAVLGPELMCLSMYDSPSELRAFLEEATETFIRVLRGQIDRTPTVAGGYVNPFGNWAPGTVVRTQCDASAFLSPAQYAKWFLPYDVRICEAVGYSSIHLHSYSMHTVEALIENEHPHAIQVTLDPETSAPTVEELLPVFRKILAVKPLIVEGELSKAQVEWLLGELPADGLSIGARQEQW